MQGNVFIDRQPHDHLARAATGHAAKPVLLHGNDGRFSRRRAALRALVFRQSAQRSDPETISGITLGETGAGGNEISNTDLLSCSGLHDARRPS